MTRVNDLLEKTDPIVTDDEVIILDSVDEVVKRAPAENFVWPTWATGATLATWPAWVVEPGSISFVYDWYIAAPSVSTVTFSASHFWMGGGRAYWTFKYIMWTEWRKIWLSWFTAYKDGNEQLAPFTVWWNSFVYNNVIYARNSSDTYLYSVPESSDISIIGNRTQLFIPAWADTNMKWFNGTNIVAMEWNDNEICEYSLVDGTKQGTTVVSWVTLWLNSYVFPMEDSSKFFFILNNSTDLLVVDYWTWTNSIVSEFSHSWHAIVWKYLMTRNANDSFNLLPSFKIS